MAKIKGKTKSYSVSKSFLKTFLKPLIIILFLLLVSNIVNADFTINFTDPKNYKNYSSFENTMVKDGKVMLAYTPEGMRQFLKGENATLEKITIEEASKLNVSDWIDYDNRLYRIVRLKEEYIENISIVWNGTLVDFQTGEYYSNIKIEIEVNETAIIKAYSTDNSVLSDLTFNYDGKSKTIEYDYKNHKYVFEDVLSLRGNGLLYPFDKYISEIQVKGGEGELFEKHQYLKSQESGFNLDAYFKKSDIKIVRSRDVLFRYFISILVLIISTIVLNSYMNNLNATQLNDRKTVVYGGILGTLAFALPLGFANLNYIKSIGILPILIFLLVVLYKFFKVSNQHSRLITFLKNNTLRKVSKKKSNKKKIKGGYSNKKSTYSKRNRQS